MKNRILKITTLFTLLLSASLANAAGGHSLNIKTASLTLSEKTQTIGSRTVTFDDSAKSVFSIEYEQEFGQGLTWGVDLTSYTNDITASTPSTSANDMSSVVISGTVRKYFDAGKYVKPYIGGGMGVSAVTIVGSGSGLAFQGMAGIKFPFDSISAVIEYKVISSDPEDDVGASVDISSSGVFAGIAINF